MAHRSWPDRLGMIMALACGLHCATLTAIFLFYPALWMKRVYWEAGLWHKLMWLEWSLLTVTWLVLVGAMLAGWLHHRNPGPGILAVLAAGLLTALIASPLHFSGRWTALAAVLAGLLVAGAHWWNLRLGRTRTLLG
jgi:hypothetical protein